MEIIEKTKDKINQKRVKLLINETRRRYKKQDFSGAKRTLNRASKMFDELSWMPKEEWEEARVHIQRLDFIIGMRT